jgi:hypothetical protein
MPEVFKKPDRKGKRFRKKCHVISLTTVLSKIRIKHKKYRHLEMKDVEDIVNKFSIFLTKKTVTHRDGVQLPEGLGVVSITSYKTNKRLIDKATSEKLGVRVYHTNMATDGFMAKIFYSNDRPGSKLANKEMWGLKGCVEFRTLASRTFKENWKMYVQLERIKKKEKKFESVTGNTPFIDPEEDYNEFDI